MSGHSPLEQLLPEVQRHILLQTDSFVTLHALILASPRIFQVFLQNKKATLSAVARRQFDSTAIEAALAVEELHQLEPPPFSRNTVLRFFDLNSDKLYGSHDSVLPLPVSNKLGKLDRTVLFFIEDYSQNTLPILAQLGKSKPRNIKTEYKHNRQAPKLELSRGESKRLRRAFCRFETYRQLFSRCSADLNHDLRQCPFEPSLTVYEQAEMFFQNTPAYLAAEVACVRDYLHRRLRGVLDRVENEIVQEAQAGCPHPKDQNEAYDWLWDNGKPYQFLGDDMHYLGYNGKDRQSLLIEHLLSLGLPYIRRILESAGGERQGLLFLRDFRCYAQDERDFITAALGLDPLGSIGQERYERLDMGIDCCLDESSKLDLPPGWLWAHARDYYHGLVDVDAKGLRDWGYVFWDRERLQKAGILDLE